MYRIGFFGSWDIILYYTDKAFGQSMAEIMDCYREAYLKDPNQVENVIISTADLMGQKENLKSYQILKIRQNIH